MRRDFDVATVEFRLSDTRDGARSSYELAAESQDGSGSQRVRFTLLKEEVGDLIDDVTVAGV